MIITNMSAAIAASKIKPAMGTPCNGCGLCCLITPCPLSRELFKQEHGTCQALVKSGDRYACGLVKEPEKFAPDRAKAVGSEMLSAAALYLIGSDDGCDARLHGEKDNPEFKAWLDSKTDIFKSFIARAAWGLLGRPNFTE